MRTQNIFDRRRFHRQHGRGFFSSMFSDGTQVVQGIKNLGSKLMPIAYD